MNFEKANELLKQKEITYCDAMDVFEFIYALIENHEQGLAIGETAVLLNKKMHEENLINGLDSVVLDLLVVKGYMQSDYPWRARSYAHSAYDKLIDYYKTNKPSEDTPEYFALLASYFSLLSDQRNALKCFEKYQEYANDEWTKFDSFYRLLICHKRLDESYNPPYSEEYVKNMFPKNHQKIINVMNNKSYLRFDPVENTKEFQDVYDEVHEKAMKIIEEQGKEYIPQQIWLVLRECFEEKGIYWKNPSIMNPGTMFD